MDNNNFSDNDIDRNAAESRRAENFDDLQNEIAGREVGRTHKFLNKDMPSGF